MAAKRFYTDINKTDKDITTIFYDVCNDEVTVFPSFLTMPEHRIYFYHVDVV